MKIEKTVETMVEVTVEVTLEDIIEAIAESTETQRDVLRGINNCYRFLRAVPAEIIAGMNADQRKIIRAGLIEQGGRYSSNG